MLTNPNFFLNRNRLFRNFLLAGTVSFLGSGIFDIAMPLYVWERTHSAIALAAVNVALHLPYFLAAPLTGFSVDNYDTRRVMLFSDIGQVLALCFLLLYDVSGAEALWPILIVVFVVKAFTITFETVSSFTLIPALVSEKDLQKANTWFLSSLRVVQILGPIAGGALLSAFGIRACILANIASFGATLYLTFHFRNAHELARDCASRMPNVTEIAKDFLHSIRFIRDSKLFHKFILVMFLWNASSLLPGTPSMVYYFTVTKALNPFHYGLAVSLFGVFGILGYLIAQYAYERFDFKTTFVGSCFWQAFLSTLALCFVTFPLGLSLVFGSSRIGASVLNMGTVLIRQTRIPRNRIGCVNATLRMFFMSAAPISSAIQGVLLQHLNVWVSLLLGAACLWGVAWYARPLADLFENKPEGKQPDRQEAA